MQFRRCCISYLNYTVHEHMHCMSAGVSDWYSEFPQVQLTDALTWSCRSGLTPAASRS